MSTTQTMMTMTEVRSMKDYAADFNTVRAGVSRMVEAGAPPDSEVASGVRFPF